jgi:GNAT superfamily N-acetyltransferase
MQIDMQPPADAVAAIYAAIARPGESPPDAAHIRETQGRSPELRYLLADGGAALVGSVFPGEETTFLPARADVLPAQRGRGVTSALLRAASAHARELGYEGLEIEAREDEDGYVDYLVRRGYVEVERQKAVALDLAVHEPEPRFVPDGIEIANRRPEHAPAMYQTWLEAKADIPGLESGFVAAYDDWHAFEIARPSRDPSLAFVALAGGTVVGYASADLLGETGYHGITGVRRSHRRRGIARALKLHQIAAAKALGLATLVTESEERNEPMRRLNESLGYRPIPGSIVLRGPLLD